MSDGIANRFPSTHVLEDGAKVTCSLMSEVDRKALTDFLSDLPSRDLAYLQVDITQPEILARWLDTIAEGKSICLCAYDPAQLVGYAALQLSEEPGANAGEIRVNIRQGYRSRGLGRILIAEIFAVAELLELKKITARMLADQYGARSAFEHLGFVQEDVLRDHVRDKSTATSDLLVMTASP